MAQSKIPNYITIMACDTCGRTSLGTATGMLANPHRRLDTRTDRLSLRCTGTAVEVTYVYTPSFLVDRTQEG
jgi:hypothetical protein